MRSANVSIVGKTNLHELAFGFTGVNHHYGTPMNPFNRAIIPGGSSSGSAVAVATGDADIAVGSDSAGSVRMPAACCGVIGVKLTNGSVPLTGVWPLAPSLDSLGVFGRDVDAAQVGAELLTGNAIKGPVAVPWIGRIRGLAAHPSVENAVDAAFHNAGIRYRDVTVPSWDAALRAVRTLITYEAWNSNRSLVTRFEEVGYGIGDDVMIRLRHGKTIVKSQLAEVSVVRAALDEEAACAFREVEVLALPTLPVPPPQLALGTAVDLARFTAPVNLLGLPALTVPVPSGSDVAGLQLVAGHGQEALLFAVARRVARAVGSPWPGLVT
jgi:amidase